MEYKEFKKEILENSSKINVNLSEKEIERLYKYMILMLEWNNNINLTAIINEKDIILKHFIDSMSVNKYIIGAKKVMDIGTGAGFPGIPLKILNESTNFLLLDSLKKRINFLEAIKKELNLDNLELIHSRAEDLAKDQKYREKADIVVSRAVAKLRILLEYMLPYVRENGICICMKGPNIESELEESKKALDVLGGKIEKKEHIILPDNLERNIILIRKVKSTPLKYPRKAGMPTKQPL